METSNIRALIILTLSFLTFYFNLCKFDVIVDCLLHTKKYIIFFWDIDAVTSNSSLRWITLHLISALFHVIVTQFYILTGDLQNAFSVSHYIFTFTIIINIWHFLQFPTIEAIAINMIPLLVMSITKRTGNMLIYFLALVSPVLIEARKYIMS
jgi:hypothetical protein